MNTLLNVLIAVLPVAAAATVGNLATMPKIGTWYVGLAKPSFNPPNWVFGPVWGLLYAIMAYAFFRVLGAQPGTWTVAAISLFLMQITLNASWSMAFFARESPRSGLFVIFPLWLGILLTAFAFWQIDRWASVLLWPYLAWVSFAVLLNREIARLNPSR
jgi:tryptophan-rich sensory protein